MVTYSTFDGLLQVLKVELVLTDENLFKLSELLGLLLNLHAQCRQHTTVRQISLD